MNNPEICRLTINDIREGYEFSFEEVISSSMLDDFANLTGDYSTIHMDKDFALRRGFKQRVAHGVLMLGLISRAVGMHVPGENAVLQTMNTRFLSPAYAGDTVVVKIIVEQVSKAANSIILNATIENIQGGSVLLRSKVQVGFTSEK